MSEDCTAPAAAAASVVARRVRVDDAAAVVLAALLAITTFAVVGNAVCLLPLIGVALCVAVLARRLRSGVAVAVLAAVLLMAHIAIGIAALGSARQAGLSEVTAANLRGIAHSLERYHETFGVHAPDLITLADSGIGTRRQIVTPFDREAIESPPSMPQTTTSFLYQPGEGAWQDDPQIILAYERRPFCCARLSLVPMKGRFYLFSSGEVRWLTTSEGGRAMLASRERRRQVGWTEWP